jgi:NDP-sugar pyrophosphorylase family protein
MKAMLLCAGYGTRLGDHTRELPKPMLPLNGQPLLAYLLSHLRTQGFDEIAINLHFRPETITEWFGDGSRWGIGLTYSREDKLAGTAGALRKLEMFFHDEPAFLVQYGDVLTGHDFRGLVQFHLARHGLATLLVHRRARSNSVVAVDDMGRITSFLERPSENERAGHDSPWVNSGVCVCSPEILEYIPADGASDLPRDVFRPLVNSGRLYAMPLAGYRCAIDSPERWREAETAIREGRCAIRPLRREEAAAGAVPG